MYLSFFKLKKEPFNVTPDPEFLFLAPSHREALASLVYGVEKRKGFIVITGEVGVGKTTVLRSYLEKADRRKLKVIYLFNPNVSFKGLLGATFEELGLEIDSENVFDRVNRLNQFLIGEYRLGNNVVLIIDEAQNLPAETLESLRLLSNLETPTDKLLQMVMIGQPELERLLQLDQLRQLRQRVAVRCNVRPLTRDESLDYVEFRLRKAGAGKGRIFARGALDAVVKQAKGIPRTINIICDNALIAGFGCQKNPIPSGIVKEVIGDLYGRGKPGPWRWVLAPTAGLLLLAGVFWFSSDRVFLSTPSQGQVVSATTVAAPVRTEAEPRGPEGLVSKPQEVAAEASVPVSAKKHIPEAGKTGEAPRDPFPLRRVVKDGENLYRLTLQVYGFSDQRLMDRVKESNPKIKDTNQINAGDEILFPEPPGKR